MNHQGLVDVAQLEAAIRPDTSIVSIMMINNEIGVRQPIEQIGAICRKHKVRPLLLFLFLYFALAEQGLALGFDSQSRGGRSCLDISRMGPDSGL